MHCNISISGWWVYYLKACLVIINSSFEKYTITISVRYYPVSIMQHILAFWSRANITYQNFDTSLHSKDSKLITIFWRNTNLLDILNIFFFILLFLPYYCMNYDPLGWNMYLKMMFRLYLFNHHVQFFIHLLAVLWSHNQSLHL